MTSSSVDGLRSNIRSAVAAELTTLPAYLYPYWSIRPLSDKGSAAGDAARRNLMAVILEEMLHLGLSSNLLNALGGTACLTADPYFPSFPCNLLRSVDHDPKAWGVEVDLYPLGQAALTMMIGIELPEWDAPGEPTLGEFYTDYVTKLLPGDDAAYAGGKQLAMWDNPGAGQLFSISNRASAERSIQEILHQGEGLDPKNMHDGDRELAHYWRFQAIQDTLDNGTLDAASDVYPVVASPRAHLQNYTAEQQQANRRFNTTYSRMLDALEQELSGESPDVYPKATGLMEQLQHQAALLRNTGTVPGTQSVAGPTFDYIADQA